ncbi:MAG: hypothetical protein JRH20_28725, partial [Deltaproteobacteria bacterium]|nr:hypothetical protein [Deltaproteobacteria bacterium]
MLISPRAPHTGQSFRVLIVSERKVLGGKLLILGPDGPLQAKTLERGGPPYWWLAEVAQPRAGSYRVALVDQAGTALRCVRTRVQRRRRGRNTRSSAEEAVWWSTSRSWNRRRENLYSAWIEHLFDAPKTER